MRNPIAYALAFLAVLAPSCTDRTRPDSEHGRRLAEHLCAAQAACDCDEELLIPDCEARVLREFLVTEQRALDAGIERDEDCFEEMLASIDGLVSCLPVSESQEVFCRVYSAGADVGEPCQIYDFVPYMTECREGLRCNDGFCRGPANPHILHEGEICSETQADIPTGDLGRCAEGLDCDSVDTRTCIPSPYWPPIPTGEVCASLTPCVPESYCRTPEAEELPSEDNPGICTLRTPEGQPCTHLFECTTGACTDGFCWTPPPRLCGTLEIWWEREWL